MVDLHSDLLWDLWARRVRGERDVFRRRHLPELAAAGVRVQVLAVYLDTWLAPELALRQAVRLVETAHREAELSDGALRVVASAAELDAALADGALAAVLSLEGVEPLGREPELIRAFRRLGVRLAGLTWNRANDFADGVCEDRGVGLTPLGRRLLDEMAECGVALDLSHLTDRAVEAALEAFAGPVLASHTNARAVYDHPRNLPDHLIAAVAAREGVCGLNFLPLLPGPGVPAERLADHRAHLARTGSEALPACGADLIDFMPLPSLEEPGVGLPTGTDPRLVELPEPARTDAYRLLAEALAARGTDPASIDATLGGNALAFLRRALG